MQDDSPRMTGRCSMKKRSSHPYLQCIIGIILTVIGVMQIVQSVTYSKPQDYSINAFDAIFIIPAILKILYYETAESLSKTGLTDGIVLCCIGAVCIIFGIRGLRNDEYVSYFKKGNLPEHLTNN